MFQFDDARRRRGHGYHFLNLTEGDLRERVITAWDVGQPVTWDGMTADSAQSSIKVFLTAKPLVADASGGDPYRRMSEGDDVTNQWISGPAGSRAAIGTSNLAGNDESPLRDARKVMVVHGRNLLARDAMFTFLRALGLAPVEWEQAISETGTATPHNLDAVRVAMETSQAVVVLLTAEDRAGLLPALGSDTEVEDLALRGQPRQNVILEAGLAMGIDRNRTILVELGPLRRASDFEGLNTVRLSNEAIRRQALRSRLTLIHE